jgi:hypothetical protein
MNGLLTAEQFAKWMGKSKRFVLENCKGRGAKIPAIHFNDRVVMFHVPTVLLAWARAAGVRDVSAADFQSPALSASPTTSTEPCASPALRLPDGASLSQEHQPSNQTT